MPSKLISNYFECQTIKFISSISPHPCNAKTMIAFIILIYVTNWKWFELKTTTQHNTKTTIIVERIALHSCHSRSARCFVCNNTCAWCASQTICQKEMDRETLTKQKSLQWKAMSAQMIWTQRGEAILSMFTGNLVDCHSLQPQLFGGI